MKALKRLFLFGILLVVILLNATCNKELKKISYNGHVFDSLGGQPVVGVRVTLNACIRNDSRDECDQFSYGTVTTDSKGYFTFGFIHAAESGAYQIMLNNGFAYAKSATSNSTFSTGSRIPEDELTGGFYSNLYLQ